LVATLKKRGKEGARDEEGEKAASTSEGGGVSGRGKKQSGKGRSAHISAQREEEEGHARDFSRLRGQDTQGLGRNPPHN